MSHQAIARKWRPRLFEEISGQVHVTRTLQNAIRLGKVHHAFLLTGARGVGKTSAARILARALNCEQGPAPNPCNECSACKDMLEGSYPDLIEIDAASHNSVDDIRDLVEKSRYTPQRGRYKVYVIDEVHMVTKQGFNALLKTLEEPPKHVIFILATTDPQELLETVVSRCQRFDFKMIPVRTIYERLAFVAEQEGVQVPEASLKVIAREGGGSMRDAQSLLDQVLSFSGEAVSEDEVAEILGFIDRSILYEVLGGALDGDPALALMALGRVKTFGYDVRTFAHQLLEAVRNVLVVQLVPESGKLLDLPDQELVTLKSLAKKADPEALQQRFDILAAAVDGIARSEQPMLLLEMAAVKMASVRPFVPVETLVRRLHELERRLGRAPGGAPSRGDDRGTRQVPPRREAPPRRAAPPRAPQRQAPARQAQPRDRRSQGGPPPPPPPPSDDDYYPEPTGEAPIASPPPPRREPPPRQPERPRARPPSGAGANILGAVLGYERSAKPAAPPPAAVDAPAPATVARPVDVPAPAAVAKPAPAPPKPALAPAPPRAPSVAATPKPPADPRVAPVRPAPAPPPPSSDALPAEPTPDPPGNEHCDGPRWRKFVHGLLRIEGLGPVRASLSRAGFVCASEAKITVGFRSTTSLRQAEQDQGNPALLDALSAAFAEGTVLVLQPDPKGGSGRTLAEELRRLEAKRRQAMEDEARRDPVIESTQVAFPGARIMKVTLPKLEELEDVG